MGDRRRWALAMLLASACGGPPMGQQCMSTSAPSPLVTGAQLLVLDVYPPDVQCDPDGVSAAAGAPAPTQSMSFGGGAPITLSTIPPGTWTVVLTAYSDGAGTIELGGACTTARFDPGSTVCLDLTLLPAPDMAAPDLTPVDFAPCQGPTCPCMVDFDCLGTIGFPRCNTQAGVCVPCVSNNDNCPFDEYCANDFTCHPGCKSNAECAALEADGGATDGGVGNKPLCDTKKDPHTCVECISSSDCSVGQLCNTKLGICTEGCDPSINKLCPGSKSCCNLICVDERNDPFNCGGCNQPCNGAASSCCNGTCTNTDVDPGNCGSCGNACSTANSTPSCSGHNCSWVCQSGFIHCGTNNTGCESALSSTTTCGGCGNACDTTTSSSQMCDGTTCTYVCNSGRGDCIAMGANTDGCETDLTTTTSRCGSCTHDCNAFEQHASGAFCANSLCNYLSCATNFADCDTDRTNGCETNTASDATHCGGCFTNCNTTEKNAIGIVCNGSACDYAACTGTFQDCNGLRTDGCESDSTSDVHNCSNCGTDCSTLVLNATGSACASSKCTYQSCNAGFQDCNGNLADGCESNSQTDAAHCGSCAISCVVNVQNASGVSCAGGACGFSMCLASNFKDCNMKAADGCEINTNTDPNHCGTCMTVCSATVQNAAGATCNGSGVCTFSGCNGGFADCNGMTGDGCETNTTNDVNHCGSCANSCSSSVQNASGLSCAMSMCNYSTCTTGFADCNGIRTDGCEINLSAVATCGTTCGNKVNCAVSALNASGIGCTAGACTFSCNAGYGDCDGSASNGCETNLNAVATCGTTCANAVNCGTAAQNANTIGCVSGACTFGCNAGFGDCDGKSSNGCETSLNATGSCGTSCANAVNCATAVQNGNSVGCTAGVCTFTCNAGFGDCDGNKANGCETNLNATTTCGTTCGNLTNCSTSVQNGTGIGCTAGICTFSCAPGFGDCDGNAANGCETSFGTVNACGTSCANKVNCSSSVQNATGIGCTTGTCTFTCSAGFGNCDGNAANGCETNTNTSTGNCGSCGGNCSASVQNATGTGCSSGACTFTCNGGFGDCDGNAANGCETNLNASATCGANCSAAINCATSVQNGNSVGCTGGVCTFTCNAGFGDCDGIKSNGCETNLNATSTCGTTCGNRTNCSTSVQNAGGIGCAGGVCTFACAGGFGDCDGNAANGCETNLNATVTCGASCSTRLNCSSTVLNATLIGCGAGACTFTCNPGFQDCDGVKSNGCETSLNATATCGTSCANAVNCAVTVQHASNVACVSGACTFTCDSGYGDCDGNEGNGCETNLNATASCGASCGTVVNCASTVKNATGIGCTGGTCTFTCNGGAADCDGDKTNGCEASLASTTSCGSCGNNCVATVQNVTGITCNAGSCGFSGCAAGWGDCDGNPANGCETNLTNNISHCGTCAINCATQTVNATGISCGNGTCTYASCNAGYGDCDTNKTNGCEVNTGTSTTNCGACGRACNNTNVATLSCSGGFCNSSCNSGFGNCTEPSAPTADDGCESNINSDANNCGACGRPCSTANVSGAPVCSLGLCASACVAGFSNCAEPVAPAVDDGCETHTQSDPNNCGGCFRACSGSNVSAKSCSNGLCTSTCSGAFLNCGTPAYPTADDGCETNGGSDTSNCGGCGRACAGTNVASLACSGSVCTSTCNSGFGNCSHPAAPSPDDGCESNTNTSTANCGGCGRACSSSGVATLSCAGGLCNSSCASGFGNCDTPSAPALDDGCESNTNSDPSNCGACGRACSNANVAALSCSGGQCNSTCTAGSGFSNCTEPVSPAPDDGCETNSNTSITNCGGCGRACSSANTATVQCSAGLCTSTCVAGGATNCVQPAYPSPDDGCEVNINTDVNHCGSCTRPCSGSNVSTKSCTGGLCNSTCAGGFSNCGTPSAPTADDGCEVQSATDVNNCGGCGRACAGTNVATKSCSGGLCNSSCNSGYTNCSSPSFPTADDGCETHTDVDTNNCGACGHACSLNNVSTLLCSAGKCTSTCVSGYSNCTQPVSPTVDDGCEIHSAVDTNNCGGCGRVCSATNVTAKICAGGLCTSSCAANFGNCAQPTYPTADDGCEVDTATDTNNCGACNRPCNSLNVATGGLKCTGGTCNSTCNSGFGNCPMPAAPAADDGCESNLTVCYGQACCPSLCGPPTHQCCVGTSCGTAPWPQAGAQYTDCSPKGTPGSNTYTSQMALEAAMADTNQTGTATAGWGSSFNSVDEVDSVCKTTGTGKSGSCTCWNYLAPGYMGMPPSANALSMIGYMHASASGGCFVPAPGDPSWN
jgi:hypothetical protein